MGEAIKGLLVPFLGTSLGAAAVFISWVMLTSFLL